MMASADLDLIVIGETHERELVEYVQDQISAGLGKALVVVNHVVSEQAGMKYCAEWLRSFVSEVPVDLDCVNVQRNFLLSRITTVALGDVARTLQIALGDFTYHREQTT